MEPENDVLFAITSEDLREEALFYLGREMSEDEYAKAKKLLQFGIGENMRQIYWAVFSELMNQDKT